MPLPDGVENVSLRHVLAPEYNPVKAHEYYLRTRQLKGRPTASAPTSSSSRISSAKPVGKTTSSKKVAPKPVHKKAATSAEVKAKIEALQGRLEKLRKVLADLVKAAKARSGVASKDKAPEKKTVAQKKAASKASKDYYDKHKNDQKPQTPDQQVKALEAKIKDIQAKIKQMQAEAKKKTPTAVKKAVPVGAGSKKN